ncbi:hypothetical protein QCE73_37250 [Caballeronia sp. LZ029]|uniref:hypothetical protein n=1 Tax=Caballeronia sp. LZ029 TaxID=3038564 RepID=UPI00285B89E0|nr:hypothetical protein [Caballeronia sp. LZ029]MDR5748830.1 hypothetical protein [Caballeronia sp. LZ029]
MSKAEQAASAVQPILVKVTDQCGMVVSAGIASATITPEPSSQTQQVGQELIKLPPLPVSLSFDEPRGGFYGEGALKNFNGSLTANSEAAFKKAVKFISDQVQDHGVELLLEGLADLIPVAGEAAIFFRFSKILITVGRNLGSANDLIEDAKDAWEVGKNYYSQATNPSPNGPVDVTVHYSNGAIQKSETRVINTPGSTPANFNFVIDTGLPCSNGPVIAGDWTGSLTQPNGPIADVLQFSMSFQVNGNSVTGSSHIVSGSAFATMSLTGTLTSDRLQFAETGITSQIAPPNGVVWCLKTGILVLSQAGASPTLSGSWIAISPPGCLPGSINLTRVVVTS